MEQPSELTNHIKQILCNLLVEPLSGMLVSTFSHPSLYHSCSPQRKKGRGLDPFKKVSEVNLVLDKLKDKH